MNEKGNRYALAALKNKRATISSEIVALERQVKARKVSLEHVDACLRLLDPTVTPDDIPNKRLPKHVNLFRQGELSRLVTDVLRKAEGKPLSTPQIAEAIMDKHSIDAGGRNTIRVRVRSNLAYLERRGKVGKLGERGTAKWTIISRQSPETEGASGDCE